MVTEASLKWRRALNVRTLKRACAANWEGGVHWTPPPSEGDVELGDDLLRLAADRHRVVTCPPYSYWRTHQRAGWQVLLHINPCRAPSIRMATWHVGDDVDQIGHKVLLHGCSIRATGYWWAGQHCHGTARVETEVDHRRRQPGARGNAHGSQGFRVLWQSGAPGAAPDRQERSFSPTPRPTSAPFKDEHLSQAWAG